MPETSPPFDREPRPPQERRSGAPESPQGDRRVVEIRDTLLHVEAYPWTGGLILWTQDARGRWLPVPLKG